MVWQQVLRVHRSSRQQNDPLVAHRYDEGVVVRTRCATHRFFWGVPLYLLSSRESGVDLSFGLVEAAGSEHGVEHVATSACERDDGLVVAFALSNFPVVIGA